MKNVRKQTLVLLCVAALVASVGSVVAWSALTSNPVTITVNPEPTAVTLTVNKETVNFGEAVVFTVTLNQPVAGALIELYCDGVKVDGVSALTNSAGIASFSYVPVVSGVYTVVASLAAT